MERLTEKVYECNLAVEAHMIVDLLSQAGISARIDGEFMQSIAGEIPMGSVVKVRVDPSRAAEAREVIADWEKLQPPPEAAAAPVRKASRFKSPLWFFFGVFVGAIAVFAWMRSAQVPGNDIDRDHDGHVDARWIVRWDGVAIAYEEDNDFDGRFEWQYAVENDQVARGVFDPDFDGRPEQVVHFINGLPVSTDFYFASGGRIVKRTFWKQGLPDRAEFDDDGDGRFERRVEYDAHGEPRL